MVWNEHRRLLAAPVDEVGALIDGLASDRDPLWPDEDWPAMRFDRPLGVGARGGHGPVRYSVVEYLPGRRIRFRFEAPAGFLGHHGFSVEETDGGVLLRHLLTVQPVGPARVSWPLVYRPLHDALLEDALDKAERSLGLGGPRTEWSPLVKALRAAAERL
ncbi:SRPBCC family protein [Nocardiopsis potens]|uniref:hypothetical protein n=1 Tax=Nocardiopsis potens TaxID=1246458 RepID=UPI000346C5E7|nr:hypothetical protein [Nocardiopsis potens]